MIPAGKGNKGADDSSYETDLTFGETAAACTDPGGPENIRHVSPLQQQAGNSLTSAGSSQDTSS